MSILVRHAMTESPQTVKPNMNAAHAAGLMKSEGVGVLPVVDGDQLVGLVTDRDLVVRVLAARKDPMEVAVGEIATRSPVTVTPDTKLSDARDLMGRHQVRRLPVMGPGTGWHLVAGRRGLGGRKHPRGGRGAS